MPDPTPNPCQSSPDACVPVRRNRYFTGRFLNALDFTNEQDYLVGRRWVHNRLLHGWGVACGLEVDYHHDEACRRRWVVIRPGIALDCRGREIVVPRPIYRELPLAPHDTQDGRSPIPLPFLLGLRYRADKEQPVPTLEDGGGCQGVHMEESYWREGYEFLEYEGQGGHFPPGYWLGPNVDTDKDKYHHDEGEGPVEEPVASPKEDGCLCPRCPTGDFVPLARIEERHPRGEPGYGGPHEGLPFRIDLDGRRFVSGVPDSLTHVARFNWTHGGPKEFRHLCYCHRGHDTHALRVFFDRPLRECHDEATGINMHTFVVQYRTDGGRLRLVPPSFDPIYHERSRSALFFFDIDCIRRDVADDTVTIYVTLRCDFIVDRYGRAVDGDHLEGRVPTGDGLAGGTFKSWFRLIIR